jgi:two-component system, NtrC family, sensor histidine kinase KinB
MRLRSKLVLAQAPLGAAMVFLGAVAAASVSSLGEKTNIVLKDNYRSVLAAQRMKDAAQKIERAAVMSSFAGGNDADVRNQVTGEEQILETELQVEEQNITEVGEAEAARDLRAVWTGCRARLHVLIDAPADDRPRRYLAELRPALAALGAGADQILVINQDAMVRKSDQAIESARRATTAILLTAAAACAAGVLASLWLTTRLLRPLSVLSLAVRRVGQGDLEARAQLMGGDEIAALARDFNAMAGHLAQYRKSSLGELIMAQNAAQAVIDSLPDPVMVIGLKGELINGNQTAAKLLKIDVESGHGLADAEPQVQKTVERLAAHVFAGNGAYVPRGMDEAIRFASPEGDRYVLPRAAPLYSPEGAIDGATVILQDVTRLLRFDELKNNLVATVAHEFRTPLTSLRMAIHMCTEGAAGPLTDKQADLLFVAREDCERLQSIVDDLLDMSRIESGRMEIAPRRTSAESLVHEAVDAHQAAAKQTRVALRTEVMPGVGDVDADPDRLKLVFSNLITNALRHTHEGEIVVRALPADDKARFEVQDTGEGIPPEHCAGIFEKYHRVPGAAHGGAGLGLFIAREIVEAHRGEIGFHSEVGKGTTFWFTIPLAREAEAGAA